MEADPEADPEAGPEGDPKADPDLHAAPPGAVDPSLDTAGAAELVRASFNSAPDGVVLLGRGDRILLWNHRFVDLWQFPPDMLARRDATEMRRHTAAQLQDPEGYLQSVARVRDIEQSQTFEPLALRDGRHFERHASPLPVIPGVPLAQGGVIVRWRDVTQRHLAGQRLIELSTLLDLAMLDADLAYWDVDITARKVRSMNDRWHTMLGYGPDDVSDDLVAWSALVHPDDDKMRRDAWEAHIRGETARYHVVFRMRHQQGHWVWILARGQAVARDAQGRATRIVGTRQDISEYKQTELGLQAMAHTDELTGVHNRRHFLERAAEELARAQRYGHPVTLLMMDLDHFKAINDRHGHAGGDEVLRSFVRTARTVMRQSDIFARVGGEEFAALLPHTTLEGAQAIAERLLDQVRSQPAEWPAGQPLAYTVSLGVAAQDPSHPPLQPDAESQPKALVLQLMSRADGALYAAKAQGRDRSVTASPPPPPPPPAPPRDPSSRA